MLLLQQSVQLKYELWHSYGMFILDFRSQCAETNPQSRIVLTTIQKPHAINDEFAFVFGAKSFATRYPAAFFNFPMV